MKDNVAFLDVCGEAETQAAMTLTRMSLVGVGLHMPH